MGSGQAWAKPLLAWWRWRNRRGCVLTAPAWVVVGVGVVAAAAGGFALGQSADGSGYRHKMDAAVDAMVLAGRAPETRSGVNVDT